jgi:hypothetical protein
VSDRPEATRPADAASALRASVRAVVRNQWSLAMDEPLRDALIGGLKESAVTDGIALLGAEDCAAHDTSSAVRALLLARYTDLRLWESDLVANAVLIAVETTTGRVRAVPALLDARHQAARWKRPPEPRPPAPVAGVAEAINTDALAIDLNERLGLDSDGGPQRIRVVWRTWQSNSIVVNRGQPSGMHTADTNDDAGDTVRTQRTVPVERSSDPALTVQLATADPRGLLPKLSIAFCVPRTPMMAERAEFVRLPEGTPPALVVRGALVATLDDQPEPRCLPFTVLLTDEVARASQTLVAGAFDLDLAEVRAPLREPGWYTVYAVIDHQISEPLRFEIPTPTVVPTD